LYFISLRDTPRGQLLRVSLDQLDQERAQVVIGQGEDTLVPLFRGTSNLLIGPSRIAAIYQMGGPAEVRVFNHQGKRLKGPRQQPFSGVSSLLKISGRKALFLSQSYTAAPAWFKFDLLSGKTQKTRLSSTSPVDFSTVKTVREFAISKDGTRVPILLLLPKGLQRQGSNPCLVTGYGGYGVNRSPRYKAHKKALLEQGFVIAHVILRGGGEYGDTWHRQGAITYKQNVFDDFTAAIQHLIARKYTSSDHLAIEGGSNGGLLMGAILTQHPKLVRTIVSHVGIYDMLRVELSPNGQYNVPEFGTVTEVTEFKALYAYSPYHRVIDGTDYPATLMLTGEEDPRVDPMHSRKMVARLQVATGGSAPILLRTGGSGHGLSTPLSGQILEIVDVHSFLFHHLGVKYQPVAN